MNTFDTNDDDSLLEKTPRKGGPIKVFMEKINYFKDLYNPSALMKKVGAVAKKAGVSTVYYVLVLFYALGNKKIPISKRITVIAALGYFIAPFDFIPDLLPAGLADDAIILYALKQISSYIDKEVEEKAKVKLHEWFGDQEIVELGDIPFFGK